jgi:tetratricopeptide (TPR) repeat protein
LERDDEAESDLLTTLSLRPEAEEARMALIELYMDTGKTRKALRVAREEIDLQPQAPSSYLLLADVHRMRGRNDQAIEAVGLALEQDPNLPGAYLRLGQLWLEEGVLRDDRVALEKAVTALESVVKMDTANGPASLALGRAYLAIGNEEKAFDELQRAAEATPIQAEAHRVLGDMYLARENFTEAATAYHVYLKLGEQSPAVLERLGDRGPSAQPGRTARQSGARLPGSGRAPIGEPGVRAGIACRCREPDSPRLVGASLERRIRSRQSSATAVTQIFGEMTYEPHS